MKKSLPSFLVLLLSLFYFPFTCQNKADSLERRLENLGVDSLRVNEMNELALHYLYSDTSLSRAFSIRALELSKKSGYRKGEARALSNIGNIYFTVGKNDKALDYYQRSLKLREQLGDLADIASSYINIGNIYYTRGEAKLSLDYFNKTLDIYLRLNDKNGLAAIHNNLGAIYNLTGDNPKAKEHYQTALQLAEELKDSNIILNALNNLGNTYSYMKDYPTAIDYLLRSLDLSEKAHDKKGIAQAYLNIASVYGFSGDNSKSIEYLQKAEKVSKEINAGFLLKDTYQSLAASYAKEKNYEKAFDYQRLYSSQSEAILSAENNRQIHEMEAKYKNEEKEKDIFKLNALNKSNRIIIYSVTSGLLLLLLTVLLFFNQYRVKQRAAAELQSQNALIELKNADLERLSIVARETENVILIMDPNGKIEWANESFTRLNGITIEQLKALKGETIYDISNNPDIKLIVENAVKEKRSVVYESLNLNKEGNLIWESTTLTPIFNETGQLKKIIIIDTDISERKIAEELIKEKNHEIMDSIRYAQRIQQVLLPSQKLLAKNLIDFFILYKPKDIVAGDFYWAQEVDGKFLLLAGDCTGHGVPGAFMSLLNISFLNEGVNEKKITRPDLILEAQRKNIIHALNPDNAEDGKDGMDCTLCSFDFKTNILQAVCANNPIWIIRRNEQHHLSLVEIVPDKQPIGYHPAPKAFTLHQYQLQKGDAVYLFTDGYADQFGGPKGKKFKYKQLLELLLKYHSRSMNDQKQVFDKAIEDWKGELEQVDDILLIGLKV
jgi:PAS domain S-box-containing protein